MDHHQNQRLSAVFGCLLPKLINADFSAIEMQDNAFFNFEPDGLSRSATIDLTNQCVKQSDHLFEMSILNLLESDHSIECIFEQVFAPIAQELGERWLRDEISFVDVHLGVLKLSSVADVIYTLLPVDETQNSPLVALSATPGDQHTFGVTLAAKALIHRGWQVNVLSGLSLNDWLNNIRGESYDMVGLSLYVDTGFTTLCDAIDQLKSDSETDAALVVVTGDFFARNPDVIAQCGADAYVSTIEETCQLVNGLKNKNTQNVTF